MEGCPIVQDLGLDAVDGVASFNIEGDAFATECLHKDLHASTQTKRKDQALLIWQGCLFVLRLGLDVVNGVASFDIEGDVVATESLHKYQHASTQTQRKDQALLIWQGCLFVLHLGLDVVNGVASFNIEGGVVASECLHKDLHASTQKQRTNQALLISKGCLIVQDLGLDVVDGVASFNIEGDAATRGDTATSLEIW